MSSCCGCGKGQQVSCSSSVKKPPVYDYVCHEVDNNFLTVKVPKNTKLNAQSDSCGNNDNSKIDRLCINEKGKKCRSPSARVNVILNKLPGPKKPEEEMLLVRSTRQLMNNDDAIKNSLEIELKTPRNYVPLPEPPPAPIIQIAAKKKKKPQKKGKNAGKKKRKK